MHRAYLIGTREKHRLDLKVHWLAGFLSLACDHKLLMRKTFLFKVEHTFEIGVDEKHRVTVFFNLFDYFHDVLKVLVDGQVPVPSMEIGKHESVSGVLALSDSAVEEAASAFSLIGLSNIVFALLGGLLSPAISGVQERVWLVTAGLLYFLFTLKTFQRRRGAMTLGTFVFLIDSIAFLTLNFSWTGLAVRLCFFYYLVVGMIQFWRKDTAET